MRLFAAAALLTLAGCGIDPAPQEFAGGIERSAAGEYTLSYVICRGELTGLTVHAGGPTLWEIEARTTPGPARSELVLGDAPRGFAEWVRLKDPLPATGMLEVQLHHSDGSRPTLLLDMSRLAEGVAVGDDGETYSPAALRANLDEFCPR